VLGKELAQELFAAPGGADLAGRIVGVQDPGQAVELLA
jgi:hypothetical protein